MTGRLALYASVLTASLIIPGCGDESTETRSPVVLSPPSAAEHGVARQEAFLARIKRAAQGNNAIVDARMNGDSELGVVLGKQVKLDQVRGLMTTLLREMRDAFPDRRLTVLAYAPNGKPLATMGYDPSVPSNANVTYTPNF